MAFGVTENGTDLSNTTFLTASDTATSGLGVGDFSVVPMMTDYASFTFDVTSIASGGGFSISNPTYGSFVAVAGVIDMQRQDFLSVDLYGPYTPGPGVPGATSGRTEIDLSFTQNGGTVSASDTLVSEPSPEPGTLALLGSGFVGVAAVTRRRQRA